MLLTESKKDPD